jgi:ABC-type uncharacterized transport system substrate-binding protein
LGGTLGARLTALVVAGGLVASAGTAVGQPAGLPRVGILCVGAGCPSLPIEVAHQLELTTFIEALRESGHVDAKTIVVDLRGVGDRRDQLPRLAAELIRRNVAVIVALGASAALEAARATRTVPIVMVGVTNAVELGLVASLARPGRNVTGINIPGDRVAMKQLQLLRETVPRLSRVALLWNPDDPGGRFAAKEREAAARSLGLELHAVEARSAPDVTAALMEVDQWKADGLIVLEDPVFATRRSETIGYALRNRLPTIGATAQFAAGGGLLAFGASQADTFRRAASFVDKILKGKKPTDLPVEEPLGYALVLNRGTARALGVIVPQSILVQADRVID